MKKTVRERRAMPVILTKVFVFTTLVAVVARAFIVCSSGEKERSFIFIFSGKTQSEKVRE